MSEVQWDGRPAVAGGYNAADAGRRAARLRRKPRCERKLHPDGPLWAEVRQYLEGGLSPEQVSAHLERVHPEEPALNVSHETIYHAIYAAPRGALQRELVALLRHGRSTREPRTRGQDRRGKLVDMVSIHVRPPEANERLIPGHWEGDLIKGAGNRSAVGTLIDRSTLFVMLVKIDGSTAESALDAYSAAFAPLPDELRQTLTYDQGKEMVEHKRLAEPPVSISTSAIRTAPGNAVSARTPMVCCASTCPKAQTCPCSRSASST